MLFRRALDPPPAKRSWVAWLIAAGLTSILFLSIGLPAGRARPGETLRGAVQRHEPMRSERVVFQTVPPPAAPSATPVPAPARSAPTPARPTPPRSHRPVRAPIAAPRPANTAPDSASHAGTPMRPPASNPAVPPLPAVVAPARGNEAASSCLGPCLAKLRAGVNVPSNLTRAQRDSVLQAIGASIPELARKLGDSVGTGGVAPPARPGAPPLTGVSIPVGLPGGGPSHAQRVHDSTVNAHVQVILQRLKLRADSVRAARRRDSLEAIAKRQRDSASVRREQQQ